LANSVDPDETPHDAASKGISIRNILNIKINKRDIPNFGNKLIQFRMMGQSTRHTWVNPRISSRPFAVVFVQSMGFELLV
jgi:hypothetical protein